jgi:3-hydroxy acid dehydrogenase / malonic semialdehyde reductase
MIKNLEGKLAYITGASSGIGKAISYSFAKTGINLVLFARREERLKELKKDLLSKYPIQVETVVLDVKNNEKTKKALENLDSKLQSPNILVNNAGLALGMEKVWEISEEDVDAVIDTNLKGVLHFLRLIVPKMLEKQEGHILNISSVAAHDSYIGGGVYSSSKFAIRTLTETLRMELAATPIRVGMLSPALTETEFSKVRFKGDSNRAKSVYEGIKALCAEDIAKAAFFVISQPPHVNIADMLIYPTNQGRCDQIHRKT